MTNKIFQENMIKDIDFYNEESDNYSRKRYPLVATHYIQFFFKERLNIALREIAYIFANKQDLSLLEVGCADGVIIKEIVSNLGKIFDTIVGIDIAPKMIEVAKKINSSQGVSYYVRGEEPNNKFDLVLELGVINYTDFEEDLVYAKQHLKNNGVYILSVAGKNSFNHLFQKRISQYKNHFSYYEYENMIKKYFSIASVFPCGFYLPLVWRLPLLGRFCQKITEKIFFFIPNLYHEKIYILK